MPSSVMAFTLHHGATFIVSHSSGDIVPGTEHGYYHLDTRFLSRRELRLDGQEPLAQNAESADWHEGYCFLSNPSLDHAARGTLGIIVRRTVADGLYEEIIIENFGDETASFALELGLAADFAYILTVKHQAMAGSSDWSPAVRVTRPAPDQVDFELKDAETRHSTEVRFSEPVDAFAEGWARFRVRLRKRETYHLRMTVTASLGDLRTRDRPVVTASTARKRGERRGELHESACSMQCDHPVLSRAFAQAVHDLASLRIKAEDGSREGEQVFAIAAGIPWYMDLFGRDSLIASYQAMLVDTSLARGTIEALARLQGTRVDEQSGEAPGKILHEYRRGPIPEAARKLIPKYPYYGTIDATPLFLIALSEYARWTGDLEFVRAHWHNVEAALRWMQEYGDRDGDGFLEYESKQGLTNQGWKDSSDSVRFRDGRIAHPPIALVEVQGYQYQALLRVAELAGCLGKGSRELTSRAAALKKRISEAYWMGDRNTFAEALDGSKQRVDSLTSNAGHLLWCDAAEPEKARAVADVLLSEEMYSGYGVRTMGEREGGYNPLSYHNGSVWPHDNSLALAGLVQAGLTEHATRLASGMLALLARVDKQQPPEVFCGYSASRYPAPVEYLHANRPQAWASGSVLLLARCIAGLTVNCMSRAVSVAPLRLTGLSRLTLSGLRIAGQSTTLHIEWKQAGPEIHLEGLPEGWHY